MPIHLIFALDKSYLFGLITAVNSILQNTASPGRLFLHIITPPTEATFFESEINAYFPHPPFQFRVREYHPNPIIQDYVQRKYQPKSRKSENAIFLLYSRLFLKDIFPDLGKVIFLDTDLIVLQDIAALFDSISFTSEHYFAATPNFFPAIFHFSRPWVAISELRKFKQTFNAGVLFIDLSFWGDQNYQQLYRYLEWEAQYNYRLFQLNDETLLNLMFKDYIHLDRKWNCCGFGNYRWISWALRKPRSEIGILHWSGGHHKPWSSKNIPYAELWHAYALGKSPP
ncbi:LPS glycosyltransferase [Synechococcus sp. PCC 6312]|uniref:LPS glycosyltransferase n=1 Tax=Synechococcus sp. (strain ATCC 27167 / PCC 6312) TaxID=195253 RepID=UPI00029F2858|nr:LPS glycosyltransferase [Synechococcus sp. PCC 6312]AFY62418.1 LPS:glycosyltransferase [Synechococcus sp. PCC 6312]